MIKDVLGILIVAYMRAVQRLDDLLTHIACRDTELVQDLLPPLRRMIQVNDLACGLAELVQRCKGHIAGEIFNALAFRRHAQVAGHLTELGSVADLVIRRLALCSGEQRVGEIAPVVGVSGRSRGDHAGEIAGRNGLTSGTANASLTLLDEPAGTHATDLAAETIAADRAGCKAIGAGKGGFEARLVGEGEHLDRGLVPASFFGGSHFLGHDGSPRILVTPKLTRHLYIGMLGFGHTQIQDLPLWIAFDG